MVPRRAGGVSDQPRHSSGAAALRPRRRSRVPNAQRGAPPSEGPLDRPGYPDGSLGRSAIDRPILRRSGQLTIARVAGAGRRLATTGRHDPGPNPPRSARRPGLAPGSRHPGTDRPGPWPGSAGRRAPGPRGCRADPRRGHHRVAGVRDQHRDPVPLPRTAAGRSAGSRPPPPASRCRSARRAPGRPSPAPAT